MIYSTGQSFKEDIGNSLNLVYFWGPQCSVCKILKPVIEELDKEDQINIVSFKW
ncbi:thioredoxin domain-containing protein [Paenibacillus sp. FA6]|uniref:thioredoxin domain-containing protein n=1 Tax=Paenibacillus sp. FA6 TaxID=3413029 RepID=UPI003F6561B5